MEENNGKPGSAPTHNSGGQKQGGLSWSQPASAPAPAQSKPVNAPSGLMPQMQKPLTVPASAPSPKVQSPMMKKSDTPAGGTGNRTRMIIAAVVVLVLLAGAWYMWGGTGPTSEGTASQTTNNTQGSTISNPTLPAGLTIDSPQDAGMQVSIKSASVAAPTWIVIYDSNNGQPGRALGASMFFPDYNGKGGTINLLRGTLPGQTYLVGESLDDGDHIFSPQNDKPVRDQSGNPVWMKFQTR